MLYTTISLLLWLLFFQALGNVPLLRHSPKNPFLAVWLGFFTAAFMSLCISIWLPLDSGAARLIIGLAALPGVMPTIRSWRGIIVDFKGRLLLPCIMGFGLILLAQGFVSCFAATGYDTDLYHQQIVRWLREYGIVPGLGNLHSRLAQTSGWLALAAFMEWGPFTARTAFILPSLWLLAALLYFSYCACRAQCAQQRMYALCLLFLCGLHLKTLYPNLYYDRAALLLYSIMISEMLPVFFLPLAGRPLLRQLTLLFILLAASILFKPIAVPSLFFALILLVVLLRKNMIPISALPRILWLPALTAALWCVLNAIQSGYPFFPLAVFPLPFEWTMRPEAIDGLRRAVQGWARWPGSGYGKALDAGLAYWLGPWLERNLANKMFIAGVAVPFIAGCAFWLAAFRRSDCLRAKLFFFLLSLAHLIYWFFQHPDSRFGLELFWTWAALGMACTLTPVRIKTILRVKGVPLALALAACLALAQTIAPLSSKEKRRALHPLQMPPRHTPFPGVRARILHAGTPQAFTLFLPPENEDRCGNSPLPCAPYPNENLSLRTPGNLGDGFRLKAF